MFLCFPNIEQSIHKIIYMIYSFLVIEKWLTYIVNRQYISLNETTVCLAFVRRNLLYAQMNHFPTVASVKRWLC